MRNRIMVVLVLIILFVTVLFLFRKDDVVDNEYELLNNSYLSYEFIDSFEQYKNFISNHEDYILDNQLSEKDFVGKKYLFYSMMIDSCSEFIDSSKLEKINNEYRLYFNISYRCGVCAPIYVTNIYEVDEKLDVFAYSKTVSRESCDPNVSYKPIIYIYPTEDMNLKIRLRNENDLLHTYPKYNGEWNVRVSTDGNIYDYGTMRNYYALYWEAYDNYKLDMSHGFVVKGVDSASFLEEKLKILGLNDYEINEFIVYWIDKLENNKYNFISFRDPNYINMPLSFSKEPDTLIRVMMDFKALDEPIDVINQQLESVERIGFTVVEWGGTYHK